MFYRNTRKPGRNYLVSRGSLYRSTNRAFAHFSREEVVMSTGIGRRDLRPSGNGAGLCRWSGSDGGGGRPSRTSLCPDQTGPPVRDGLPAVDAVGRELVSAVE